MEHLVSNVIRAYTEMLTRYADFSGKTGLKKYWYAVLGDVIISIVLGIPGMLWNLLGIISGIYVLLVLVPSLAMTVRRLRDVGKEWWWILLCLIPVVGWIIVLLSLIKPGSTAE